MKYICVDRGTEKCPCHLMASGQCYTCTMAQTGECSCGEGHGWLGVCPYIEYIQQGERILISDRISQFDVLSKIQYPGGLFLIRLAVPRGFAEKCRIPGAYVMAEALGWRTPVSVLRTSGQSSVDFLVKAAGPKTQVLTLDTCGTWKVSGPYYSGLLNLDAVMTAPAQEEITSEILVIARGTAAAPLVNLMDCVQKNFRLYIDDEMLPEPFMEEYFLGRPYQSVRLQNPETLEQMKRLLLQHLKTGPAVLLVSPYFAEKLTESLTQAERRRIVLPNHANMCCAMGLCGACSYTDEDGATVRLCKCSEKMIK